MGPEAVANATTSAVVVSCVVVLVADYVVTSAMLRSGGSGEGSTFLLLGIYALNTSG